MDTLFTTDDLPMADRFECYRALLGTLPVPVDIRTRRPDDFSVRMSAARLGPVTVVRLASRTAEPYQVDRTPALIRRSDPEAYRLVLNCRGRSALTHAGRDAALGPRDLALYDTSLPFHGWRGSAAPGAGPARSTPGPGPGSDIWIMATFPRPLLSIPPRRIGPIVGARLSGQDGLGALMSGFLARLAFNAAPCQPAQAARLGAVFTDLLAVLLAHALDAEALAPPECVEQARWLRIQEYIESRLGSPALSTATVAAAHHISTRCLQKLFQAHGHTVAGWIRTRRLECCRRDLADPALADRPVHTIGTRWGFPDAAHFSRVFHAAYGLSPSRFRRLQLAARPDLTSPDLKATGP